MLCKAQILCRINQTFAIPSRNLTATEVSTALRPFYFSVHPDLFGQHPEERAVNESSLQQLSSTLANIQASKPTRPVSLNFYFRDRAQKRVSCRLIKIHIKERDIRSAITTILKSCELPTDYVDSILKDESVKESPFNIRYKNDIDLTNFNPNHPIYAAMHVKVKEAQDALNLKKFLEKNHKDALEKAEKGAYYREEINNLKNTITKELELQEIKWECGWNDTHFRGCLLSFRSLVEHHPIIRSLLKGRVLVFSFFTGVSLDGHVMLYSGEVRHNWLDFLKNIPKYDAALTRIPAFERSLSHVLRNIKVGRRKFMPKIVAGVYEQNLKQVTTALNDYIGLKSYPREWPDSLEDYEIVIETEAGPTMVSPTGQFIVPCTLPGTMLVNFITKNLIDAKQKNLIYQSHKHLERALRQKCIEELQLWDLTKDDNVTPDLMIECCQKLFENKLEIREFTRGLRLNISTYYSVLTDGVVCIPCKFEL